MRKPLIALEALMLGIEIEFPGEKGYAERTFCLRHGGLALKAFQYENGRVCTDRPPVWLGVEIRVDDFIEMAGAWTDAYTHQIQVKIMQTKIKQAKR